MFNAYVVFDAYTKLNTFPLFFPDNVGFGLGFFNFNFTVFQLKIKFKQLEKPMPAPKLNPITSAFYKKTHMVKVIHLLVGITGISRGETRDTLAIIIIVFQKKKKKTLLSSTFYFPKCPYFSRYKAHLYYWRENPISFSHCS